MNKTQNMVQNINNIGKENKENNKKVFDELILAEKPTAARKIAYALAEGDVIAKRDSGVPYYIIRHKNKRIVVTSALGHIYELIEKKEAKDKVPQFEIEWAISNNKNAKKFVNVIRKLCEKSKELTIACDYDIEGEVIGLNILRYACKRNDANRMKFSTLTKPDLIKAYEEKMPHIDWGQANAGETRHILDWFYGINTSRALMRCMSNAGMFKIMSSGRVQGPALKIVVDREREIKKFRPVPYWVISIDYRKKNQSKIKSNNGPILNAIYIEEKVFDESKAKSIVKKVKASKFGIVKDIETTKQTIKPPHPFDLTTLQIEAYKHFKITPKECLNIAQDLYINGYISYPRTSSQKLPKEIGYRRIISSLAKQPEYENLAKILMMKEKLWPNNGKKTDPAHPAIYPTGIIPKNLDKRSQKIYDLIVKRFLACFADPAIKDNTKLYVEVEGEIFITKGSLTKHRGWYDFYVPYIKIEDKELPAMRINEEVIIEKVRKEKKETQPPKRYTQASLVKELEKLALGTKATRATIIDTLFKRGYVYGRTIRPTPLGIKLIEVLEKYNPKIIDQELTRNFEQDMERIRENKENKDRVIGRAKEVITEIIKDFEQNKDAIGKMLIDSVKEGEELGKCPRCKQGNLILKKGKYGLFIACDRYPNCNYTINLARGMRVQKTDKKCPVCGSQIVNVWYNRRRKEVCINIDCPTKNLDEKKMAMIGQKCPKCGEGVLELKKTLFGNIIICSRYPKCKYIINKG